MKALTDYDKQAQEFLDKTGTKFEVKFIEYGLHFDGDKDKRDIYLITLSRGTREFSFRFGQSINCSGRFWRYGNHKRGVANGYRSRNGAYLPPMAIGEHRAWDKNKNFKAPTPYDVLSCLQKHEVGTLEDFCSDFGYDTDSRKAEKTYNAVLNEYNNLKMLYSDSELELLAEIQ